MSIEAPEINLESQAEDLAISLGELKRLIAEWNRQEVAESKRHGYDISGKKTYVNEIVGYILDPEKREENELKDESAMKTVIFLEWADKNGRKIFKEKYEKQKAAA